MKATQAWLTILALVLGFLSAIFLDLPQLRTKLESIWYSHVVPLQHGYTTQILFTDPLMLYINDFIDQTEIAELLAIGDSLFEPSTIARGEYSKERTSNSCFLRGNEAVVQRVKQRAVDFLGAVPFDGIETPQLVRYEKNQTFNLHMDWFRTPIEDAEGHKYNRVASFFIYLDANCTAGETWFPKLPSPIAAGSISNRFAKIEGRDGLAVTPRAGSGVFWFNLDEDNTGDERTLHAGLPVDTGSKVGMNIWMKRYV